MKPTALNGLSQTKLLIESLDEDIEYIDQRKQRLINELRIKIDTYWDYFNAENTRISNLRKVGDTTLCVSNIAPVIEVKRSGNKDDAFERVYIIWKIHNRHFREKLRKHTGRRISPSKPLHSYKSSNIKNILAKHCSWNKQRALELEEELESYRVALSGLHQSFIRLRSSRRTLEKHHIPTQHNEEISHAS